MTDKIKNTIEYTENSMPIPTEINRRAVAMRMSMPHYDRMCQIAVEVSSDLGIPLCKMMGHNRQREVAHARQIAMKEMNSLGIETQEIGRFLVVTTARSTKGSSESIERRSAWDEPDQTRL